MKTKSASSSDFLKNKKEYFDFVVEDNILFVDYKNYSCRILISKEFLYSLLKKEDVFNKKNYNINDFLKLLNEKTNREI